MRSIAIVLTGYLCLAGTGALAASPAPTTDEQKTLYALGLALSQGLGSFALSEAELEQVKVGLTDGVLNRPPKADLKAYGPKIQKLAESRAAVVANAEKKAGAAYVAKAASESGAKKTASGAVVIPMKAGNGPSPTKDDTVNVHYHGTLIDGTVFDSSVQRGEPARFPLGNVIKCWTEGLQMIKVGGKSKLVCPSDVAYGDAGRPPAIKPGATLIFEVELLEIVK
ncbi:peptidyl-prolyl cis-trans isomerase [Nitrospira sp.]|nr:peptidyl-prolyl cis-trans isomerase [Nitrospira sp.]